MWSALGDKVVRAIVLRLAERPRAVVELAESLPLPAAVSQHLKVLKEAGLSRRSRPGPVGSTTSTRLASPRCRTSSTFWNRALSGFQDLADQPEEKQ